MIVGARCFSLCWGTLCSNYGWLISYKFFGGICEWCEVTYPNGQASNYTGKCGYSPRSCPPVKVLLDMHMDKYQWKRLLIDAGETTAEYGRGTQTG